MASSHALTRRTVLCSPVLLMACKTQAPVIELTGATMGTSYRVAAIDATGQTTKGSVESAIVAALDAVNAEMSNWSATSEVTRVNAGAGEIPLSEGLAEVLHAADAVHFASGGRFDVTMTPLLDLWGFGAAGMRDAVPPQSAIEAELARGGQAGAYALDGNTLTKLRADTQIHLSAIGKGHGVDRVARALAALGLSDFMVEIGGDIYAQGLNPDGLPWRLGVETPDMRLNQVQQILGVSGRGLATSGDYRNYFEQDGVRYSHVLDATTGHPVTHQTASATVVADTAMLADAWATAMLALGSEAGLALAEDQGLAVVFIDRAPQSVGGGFVTRASAALDAYRV